MKCTGRSLDIAFKPTTYKPHAEYPPLIQTEMLPPAEACPFFTSSPTSLMTTFLTASGVPLTSITLRSFSSRPSNSFGMMSRWKSKEGSEERAEATASLNLAGCAVERTI